MARFPGNQRRIVVGVVTVLGVIALALPVRADHPEGTTPVPGFRPDSEHTAVFLEALDTATITVYPSLVRRASRTAVSFASQEQIVALLNGQNIANASAKNYRIDLGKLYARSQWLVFNDDMQKIAGALQKRANDGDYRLVMEVLLPIDNQAVFGIHVYILDRHGQNAFSFLLNSHHRLFAAARLKADDSSEAAHARLIDKATQVALSALQAQLELAKVCITHTEAHPVRVAAGLVEGFESTLPSGADRFGNPVGYVTFTDGSSSIEFATTETYPPLPPKADKNSVLRLDMNVTGWAAFAHLFQNHETDQWLSFDWSELDKMSFWFYGNNSGVRFFVDILDNRKPCSTSDDAERYAYEFTDNFSGWERVTVPFADMVRKEVGNDAPNDGLGLTAVHGWAIGALNTGGPATFYIEDLDVFSAPPADFDYPINERPMYGGLEKTAAQKRADKHYIQLATRGGRSRTEAAEMAARTGWNLFYTGDRATAIKRFNQAWLLDPTNQHALWGFAVVSADRDQLEAAVRFFRMAIANGPENSSLRRDYNFALKQLKTRAAEN
ncbi:MAG: hypothetical protein HKN70_05545 [Gammaproteobacteria bacterium]|nr:hypothetical protein [Gammaproteobacteria bacterium]